MNLKEQFENKTLLSKILLVLILLILLPILLILIILHFSWVFILSVAIWIVWGFQGHYILFVYSNSPNWSKYIEEEIIPHVKGKAVILNWSERKQWKMSLAVLAFNHFGGSRDFNPLAIGFRPFRFNKEFRFYEAFKEYKNGKTDNLEKMKSSLLYL